MASRKSQLIDRWVMRYRTKYGHQGAIRKVKSRLASLLIEREEHKNDSLRSEIMGTLYARLSRKSGQ